MAEVEEIVDGQELDQVPEAEPKPELKESVPDNDVGTTTLQEQTQLNENVLQAGGQTEGAETGDAETGGAEVGGVGTGVETGSGEKKWPGWPGDSVFRMLIPAQKVGSIIGRKGEVIKKMVEETRAHIKVLDGPHVTAERAVLFAKFKVPINHQYNIELEE